VKRRKSHFAIRLYSFMSEPPYQSPPNFEQTSHQLRKGYQLGMTLPTQPPDIRVPQAPKPKQITGEKTLLYKKCIKFFPGSAGPRLASNNNINMRAEFLSEDCLHLSVYTPHNPDQVCSWPFIKTHLMIFIPTWILGFDPIFSCDGLYPWRWLQQWIPTHDGPGKARRCCWHCTSYNQLQIGSAGYKRLIFGVFNY